MNAIGGVLRSFVTPLTRKKVSRVDRTATASAPSDLPRRTTTKCGITFHSYFVVAPRPSEATGVRVLSPEFNAVGLYVSVNNPLESAEYLSSNDFHMRIAAAAKPAITEIMRVHDLKNEDELRRKYEVHIFCKDVSTSNDGQVFYWPRP